MKKLLLALLLPVAAGAQNFHTVQLNDTSWFSANVSSSNISFSAIHITSTSAISGDSTFHNYAVNTHHVYNATCFILTDTSWLGWPVVRRTSGADVFFNVHGDSIVIQTGAALNNSWHVFELGSGDYLQGTVTSIAMQTVLGQNDNVKTITLQALNASNQPIAHAFNGKTIQLSEHYGFVQAFNFYDFPNDPIERVLAGKSSIPAGMGNLTAAQIYDFNVGDQFDYQGQEFSPPPPFQPGFDTYRTRIVTAKTLNANSVQYTYSESFCKKYGTTIVSSYQNQTTNETIDYAFYDTTYFFRYLPEALKAPLDTSHNWTSFMDEGSLYYQDPGMYNGRLQRTYDRIWPYGYDSVQHCWSGLTVSFGPCDSWHNKYAAGLGKVFDMPTNYCTNYFLVYYQKGNETWGTPLNWSVIMGIPEQAEAGQYLHVFPVPAKNEAMLELPEGRGTKEITIFNSIGAVVQKISWPSGSLTYRLPLESLAPGVYSVRVTGEAVNRTGRLVKE